MGSQAYQVQVYRGGKWIKISSDDLLPGDIVSVGTCSVCACMHVCVCVYVCECVCV